LSGLALPLRARSHGYLAYRSGYVPRFLGALLVIAGLGYVVDSVGGVLTGGTWTEVGSDDVPRELLLAFWLVIRSRRLASAEPVIMTPRSG
jgi:hypothetical protein